MYYVDEFILFFFFLFLLFFFFFWFFFFFFQAEDGIRDVAVTGVQTCALPILSSNSATKLASQQSIKAYVDATITAQDLDFIGDSGGSLSIDLRSEERRVGKECRTRGAPDALKKKKKEYPCANMR